MGFGLVVLPVLAGAAAAELSLSRERSERRGYVAFAMEWTNLLVFLESTFILLLQRFDPISLHILAGAAGEDLPDAGPAARRAPGVRAGQSQTVSFASFHSHPTLPAALGEQGAGRREIKKAHPLRGGPCLFEA